MGNIIDVSSAKTSSEQEAELYIAQQFSGNCDVTCQNIISGANIDLINTVVGGDVSITQSCSADGNCLVSNVSDAIADTVFKAHNSSNAHQAAGFGLFSWKDAEAKSSQKIRESITQTSNMECKISSLNQMNDVSIYAANSNIGGNVGIAQTGETTGGCVLQNNMSAAAYATGIAQNVAKSGKDKKGGKSKVFQTIMYIIIILVVVVVVVIISKLITTELGKKKGITSGGKSKFSLDGLKGIYNRGVGGVV
ncbi:hypothetical protein OAG24_00740 [bacterium]|nr:hypothetical protein [bacterium]